MILRFLRLFPQFTEALASRDRAWLDAAKLGNELAQANAAIRELRAELQAAKDDLENWIVESAEMEDCR
jgi:hypothetical protein